MAMGWVKSLQCKSRAFEDVYHPSPKHILSTSTSCRKSSQTIKDVIPTQYKKTKPRPKQPLERPDPAPSPSHFRVSGLGFPSLAELPEGHPSRNVVEIIFHTGWSPKPFPGLIEMVFKVQNGSKLATRFENYRQEVKSRVGSVGLKNPDENARCVADGNEVMRFRCLGPASAAGFGGDSGCVWGGAAVKGDAVCTFSDSRWAHESWGGGRGRRAVIVCRVIAGRVVKRVGLEKLVDGLGCGFDSVSGENGELVVFDSRAVLPCFLIIYRL